MSQETTMTTLTITVHNASSPPAKRRVLLASLAAAACLLIGGLLPSSALAAFNIVSFTGSTINQDGTPDTQAGSHPFASTTSFTFGTTTQPGGQTIPDGNMKDVQVGLPAGFVGNPNATPKCLPVDLSANACAPSTQVGVLSLATAFGAISLPVFNMVPPPGVPAEFGADVLLVNAYIDIVVRTGGDYGLTAQLSDISAGLPLTGSSLTLWGVPADPSHDAQRTCPGFTSPCSAGVPPTPFLTNPTSCSGPLTTTLRADSWQNPGSFVTSSFSGPAITGCGALSFNSTISVTPSTAVADAPTGLRVDVGVPQATPDPGGLATPALQKTVVTLPQGMSLSPSSGDGLQACSPSQIGIDNASEPTCPDASRIGTTEIDSPISADPLTGGIFLAQPPDPFKGALAIYSVAEADGVLIKLTGNIALNPTTGQLTTTFANTPQLPFSHFILNFFSGPRATLATPESCGTDTATSDMQPWSSPGTGPDKTPSASFAISSGCVSGFSPSFTAGITSPQAGAFSSFGLSFSRSDTDQELSGLSVTLPPGVLAKLAAVAECSEAQIAHARSNTGAAEQASPSCPATSQVGTAATGAGPGSDPLFLPGEVYLTGPYAGAPYGLAVVVPAVAGPFDLGTVVVRQALFVDPTDAHVTVRSDPFPSILQGIPLRLRRVDVLLDRANFTVNPTSCNATQVMGTLTSTAGANANVGSRFQVGGCRTLGFNPKLAISLSGKGKTHSGNHPTLTANLTPHSGQANIASARVTLPLSLALDPRNSQRVCSFSVAQAVQTGAPGCPANTIVGTASATTPLLSQPLSGNVYLVQGIRTNSKGQQIKTLPSLLIPLRGQLALNLRASTSVSGAGQLITMFSNVPDVAVSAFKLQITGGSNGLLVITGSRENICTASQISNATLNAQSGKQENLSIKMGTPCGKQTNKTHKKTKNTRKASHRSR
jgi:hypothetical protein